MTTPHTCCLDSRVDTNTKKQNVHTSFEMLMDCLCFKKVDGWFSSGVSKMGRKSTSFLEQ